ncbi:hypothetical protein MUK42_15055 [Musa troglodytarum]|uniref:Uncharacterized protein n=1 Tax=Musa troglodytarum TaxID=320322 RepID=A0A9E7IFQ2_9LILI|nr:hypothetical protein MUK42_15055 [Musa troglodytarum]
MRKGRPGARPQESSCMGRSPSSTQRLVVITMGLLAVLSPLYVGRRGRVEPDDDGGGGALSLWLLLLLLLLVFVINLTCCADRRIMRCKASLGG